MAEKQRLAKQQALQKEREEKEKQKEARVGRCWSAHLLRTQIFWQEERKKQEAERQKVAAEKKRLQVT